MTGVVPARQRVLRHAGLELRLLLRNGEQLLLMVVIPIGLLVGLSVFDLPGGGDVDQALPGVLAISVIAVAFTSLAIATGFERRYDVLRWYGSLPLGRGGLLAGKATATLGLVVVQSLVLLATALVLGWRPAGSPAAVAAALVIGTGCFAALALLLAGALRPEATLAAANLIWLLLLAFGATVVPLDRYPAALQPFLELLPSAALTTALTEGLRGVWAPASLLVLGVWGTVAGLIAARTFRWN